MVPHRIWPALACLMASCSAEAVQAPHADSKALTPDQLAPAWSARAPVPVCGSWSRREDFGSQSFVSHRYEVSVRSDGQIEFKVELLGGQWTPRVRGMTETGEPLGLALASSADGLAATLDASSIDLPGTVSLFVTSAEFLAGMEPPPYDAAYRLTIDEACGPDTEFFSWNTYYYLAHESEHADEPAALYDRSCNTIAQVPRGFYEEACVQGSGVLRDGSIIRYDGTCGCALPCPTGGRVCFLKDDDAPSWSIGAAGTPLQPLRSLAVDRDLIPLGTKVYMAEWDGVRLPKVGEVGGFTHDGCFSADDVGGAIAGVHIDIFTGTSSMRRSLERVFPTGSDFTLRMNDARCD